MSTTRTTITLRVEELKEMKKKAKAEFGGNVSLFLRTLTKRYVAKEWDTSDVKLTKGK